MWMADQQQDEERARVRAPVAAVFVASDGTCATHDASPAAVVPEVLPEVKDCDYTSKDDYNTIMGKIDRIPGKQVAFNDFV